MLLVVGTAVFRQTLLGPDLGEAPKARILVLGEPRDPSRRLGRLHRHECVRRTGDDVVAPDVEDFVIRSLWPSR
jgi:hypothetical protein